MKEDIPTLFLVRARHRRRDAAHTGDGAEHHDRARILRDALSSPPGGGACAGRPPGGSAGPRRAYTALAREHQERDQAEAHNRQAHCHRSLGKLYATIGRRGEACTDLSTAIALYHAIEMTFWLPQAEAVLAQVEGR
jgi:hypothetical protein